MRLEHLVRMVRVLDNSHRQAQRARDNMRERTQQLPAAQAWLLKMAAEEKPDDRLERAAAEYIKLVRGMRAAREAQARNERNALDAAERLKYELRLED